MRPDYDPKTHDTMRVGSSVGQTAEGKFVAIIHWVTGKEKESMCVDPDTVITVSPPFDTAEEAMKVGSAILSKGAEGARAEGVSIERPGKA